MKLNWRSDRKKKILIDEYSKFIIHFNKIKNLKYKSNDGFTVEYIGATKIKLENDYQIDEFIFYKNENPSEIKNISILLAPNKIRSLTFINCGFTSDGKLLNGKYYYYPNVNKRNTAGDKELINSEDIFNIFIKYISHVLNPPKIDDAVIKDIEESETFEDLKEMYPHIKILINNHETENNTKESEIKIFRINKSGSIWLIKDENTSYEYTKYTGDLNNEFVNAEDYLTKINFLIKYLTKQKGIAITDKELYNSDTYNDIIEIKLKNDPSLITSLTKLPKSINQTDFGKGDSVLKRFGTYNND